MAGLMKRIINTVKAPKAIGPYSQAVAAGNTVYLSGQIGANPDTGNLAEGGIEGETHQMLKNVKAVLNADGLEFGNVVKCTVFLADINDFQKMNKVYAEYFTKDFPARAAFQVAALPKNARVEMECIAVKD